MRRLCLPNGRPHLGRPHAPQKSDFLMTTLFETALQLLYFQFGREKPPGLHGKMEAAMAELRSTLEMSELFKGRVPSAETIDK